MSFGKMNMFSSALCLIVVLLSVAEQIEPRNVDSLGLGGFSSSGILRGAKAKRQLFDTSCKGIYDRELLSQLERVCEDCYNLYRKAHVSTECRRDCYSTEVFEGCLRDLFLHDYVSEYKDMVHLVAGKK